MADRWKVLVVDDDKAIINLLEVILEGEGFEFVCAYTGKSAIDMWSGNSECPPIVLLDWTLPDIPGIEVCKAIRAHPQGSFPYIMFLSAKGLREYRIAGMAAGADDYVVKPIHAEELKARLRSAVRILELQKQLIERNKMLEEFVYSVTHDMRTPLLAMDMTASHASEGVYGSLPESYVKILSKTRRSISDLLKMADNVLGIARYETGDVEVYDERTDLLQVAGECMSELEPLYKQKSIVIDLDSNIQSVNVSMNRQDLKRIIQNLLDNAIKFTPSEGRIKLSVELASNKVFFMVQDSGQGLAKEEARKVFERFRRAKGSGHVPGTGLGLYLCRKIIEAHGGIVDCIPRPGGGTTFSFLLPVSE